MIILISIYFVNLYDKNVYNILKFYIKGIIRCRKEEDL